MKTKCFLVLVFVFTVLLSACGNLSGDGNKTTGLSSKISPKQTIQIAFEALKNGDSKKFNQFIQYNDRREGVFVYKDNKLFGNNLDETEKEFIKNFSYDIGEVKENGNVTTAQVKITNRDLSNAYKDIPHYKDADNPLIEAIKNSDNKMVTSNLKITLNKTDGMWKIQMDAALADALCGGLLKKMLHGFLYNIM
ncbi:hypothetical protein D9O40_12615 [Clostridium autoethanogenum]|uniref:Lumazine-binding domain protein n=2 Tax=Clostridium TaxID=1485 RepID=D8GUK3_CLOLD|nr:MULTISPECIES: membrane protein [Clostridium]ADK16880.1 conserved hypothetical protein [Clostridium ljungdahlii DSM 13528]OAA85259.1 Lumazine-binding domain protein [Clostridium ljungdahlii DSM 13528]RMC98833.1 hypothetical protein D9O40_12615 [Clostridium autoethanogenum]